MRWRKLGRTFFGLTTEYRSEVLEEIFQLVFHCKMSRFDARLMPVHERQWFIVRTNKEIEDMKKEIESNTNSNTSNKRRRK